MTITTIITTFRRPHLLKRAVQSVLNQTYTNIKICVYDNASNDETEEIMNEFVKKDSRVFYHRHPENIGMMHNYKFAFSKINTLYFSFLSDDDFLLPWFYETAMEGFKRYSDIAFSACEVLIVNEQGELVISDPISTWKKEGYYSMPEGILEMVGKDRSKFPVPTTVLFQSKLVLEINPDWSEEIQLWWDPNYLLNIASRYPIYITKKTCGIYVVHPDGFCTAYYNQAIESGKKMETFFIAINKLLSNVNANFYVSNPVAGVIKDAFINCVKLLVQSTIKHFLHKKKYADAYQTNVLFQKYFGFYLSLFFLKIETILKLILNKYIPFAKPLVRLILFPYRFLKYRQHKIAQETQGIEKKKTCFPEYQEWVAKYSIKGSIVS